MNSSTALTSQPALGSVPKYCGAIGHRPFDVLAGAGDQLVLGARGVRGVGEQRRAVGLRVVAEACRAGDLATRQLDDLELLEPDAVDLLGRQLQRRPGPDLGPVEGVAVRRRPDARLLAGRREVVAAERLEERRVGRVDDVADDVADPLAVGIRGDLGHRRDDRLLDRDREQALQLLDGPLGDDPRGRQARFDALLEDADVRRHVGRVGLEAGDEHLEPLGRVGLLELADLRQDSLGAVDLVDDAQPVGALVVLLDADVGDHDQHVAGDPVLDRQAVGGDRLRLAPGADEELAGLRPAGRARVLEPVVVALVAVDRRGRRIELEELLPEAVGELADGRVRVNG